MKLNEVAEKLRLNKNTVVGKIHRGELMATLHNTFNGKRCHEYWWIEQKDIEEYLKRYEQNKSNPEVIGLFKKE